MLNVLSIDGGGIRGLIPALVLQELEESTGTRTADLFDFVAGTSTGGILALGLTCTADGEEADGSPRYSAAELADLYRTHGSDIFTRTHLRTVTSALGYIDEKYDHTPLEEVLAEYFGDLPLGRAVTDTMIPTYDLQSREPFFFKSWQTPDEYVPMRRAARATSAAPTYFEPAPVTLGDRERVLIDGGVFVNNPAMSAYAEVRKRHPEADIRVVSVGTGTATDPFSYEEAKDWGTLEWALPTLDIVFDGVSDAVRYQLKHVLGEQFTRFEVPLESASDAMDDASRRNLQRLADEAERLISLRQDDLTRLSEQLG